MTDMAKVPGETCKSASALPTVDAYPDYKTVSVAVEVGVDRSCTNLGNTGSDVKACEAAVRVKYHNTLTCTGANVGLSEKDT